MEIKEKFWVDRPATEIHDVFKVVQITPNTSLSSIIGADFIRIEPSQNSEIHRHNYSRTVIIVTYGYAKIILETSEIDVSKGDRIYIDRGIYHGFITKDSAIEFISIQSPPILDHENGIFDKEVRP